LVSSLPRSSPLHLQLLEGTLPSVQHSDIASYLHTPPYLHEVLVAASGWRPKALKQQLPTLRQCPALPKCAKPALEYL
jgi:hypothetical protein